MSASRPGIPLLQNTSTIGVLLYVLENEGCTKMRVYENVTHNSTVASKISELADAGLITMRKTGRNNTADALYLTDSGREVAVRLREIGEILESAPYSH